MRAIEKSKERARVAFYTRISTDEDHQKYSQDAQKDRLEAFCKSQYGDEWELARLYRDAESGTHMTRPGITHVLCGARSPEQARENAAAADVKLSEHELGAINDAIEKHGPDIV